MQQSHSVFAFACDACQMMRLMRLLAGAHLERNA